MFETIAALATVTMAGGAAGAGYVGSKRFVKERLRFEDQIQRPGAAIVAGPVAALAAVPVVALLPFVGGGTALLFGVAVGAGTRAGARQIRRWISD
ncbi:MAG: hypothetical protein FIB01_14325 [Gemmatimonadetes bacterium]|nr:hypothetical protein [Gemmatimonadota bacterium]